MKRVQTINHLAMLLLSVVLLTACNGTAMTPEIKSAKDSIAVNYSAIGSGATITQQLLESGQIDADTARMSKSKLERALELNAAAERAVLAGKPSDAQGVLRTTAELLTDIQTMLRRELK